MVSVPHLLDAAAEILGHREFSLVGTAADWHLVAGDGDGIAHAWVDQYGAIEQRASELAAVAAIDDYRIAIENHVDAVAQSRAYSGGVSLASYVASTNPAWAAEAQAFVAWRDGVWAYAYAELDKVQTGQRPQPTVEAFIGELDPIAWP